MTIVQNHTQMHVCNTFVHAQTHSLTQTHIHTQNGNIEMELVFQQVLVAIKLLAECFLLPGLLVTEMLLELGGDSYRSRAVAVVAVLHRLRSGFVFQLLLLCPVCRPNQRRSLLKEIRHVSNLRRKKNKGQECHLFR